MEAEKMQINIGDGVTKAEVIIREGAATKELDPKAPVNSNLPASFMLNIPIFKGMTAESLEVETFAQINGREVAFTLLSPGAKETLEDIRDKAIDVELEKIREIAPNIAIIEQ